VMNVVFDVGGAIGCADPVDAAEAAFLVVLLLFL